MMAALGAAGCGASWAGDWVGQVEIEATDGEEFVSELTLDADGYAEAVTVATAAIADTGGAVAILEAEWEGEWVDGAEGPRVWLDCVSEGCVLDAVWVCEPNSDGDELTCDSFPDLYEDDEDNLVFERE